MHGSKAFSMTEPHVLGHLFCIQPFFNLSDLRDLYKKIHYKKVHLLY